jgi:hypothetical protein
VRIIRPGQLNLHLRAVNISAMIDLAANAGLRHFRTTSYVLLVLYEVFALCAAVVSVVVVLSTFKRTLSALSRTHKEIIGDGCACFYCSSRMELPSGLCRHYVPMLSTGSQDTPNLFYKISQLATTTILGRRP